MYSMYTMTMPPPLPLNLEAYYKQIWGYNINKTKHNMEVFVKTEREK